MNSGDYDTRFTWHQLSKSKEATYGEMLEDTQEGQSLWGCVETLTGRRMRQLGLAGNVTATVIRIRNYPDVLFNDTLIDERFGITYIVDTVHVGSDELIITAHADEE